MKEGKKKEGNMTKKQRDDLYSYIKALPAHKQRLFIERIEKLLATLSE